MSNSTGKHDEYGDIAFTEAEADPNPFVQFGLWFSDACRTDCRHPEAMTLATATPRGIVAARIVLLKGFDERGFAFFTNYNSDKAGDLKANPHAALVFWWDQLHRQVRLTGAVETVSDAESDEYFATRPRTSQLSAWASSQSEAIIGRGMLEQRFAEYEERFRDREVERPRHWGGYRLVPGMFEFWQGRRNRLHDRIRYTKVSSGSWQITRLAP